MPNKNPTEIILPHCTIKLSHKELIGSEISSKNDGYSTFASKYPDGNIEIRWEDGSFFRMKGIAHIIVSKTRISCHSTSLWNKDFIFGIDLDTKKAASRYPVEKGEHSYSIKVYPDPDRQNTPSTTITLSSHFVFEE